MAAHKRKKLQMSLDTTPSKKSKRNFFGNFIELIVTRASHLVVAIATRADKSKGPYTKPIVDAYEEEVGGELASKWNVMKIVPRKGLERGDGTCDPGTKSPGSRINWDTFILVKTSEQVAAEELGKNLAKELTNFVESSSKVSVKVKEMHWQCSFSHFCCANTV